MNVIVYQSENNVAIVTPAEGVALEQVIKLSIPPEIKCIVMDNSALPDDYFRDAWVVDDNMHITVDTFKAKQIQKNYWRKIRNKKLKELDYEFMLALEEGNEEKIINIKQKKQALRDVTAIQLPDNIEDIKNVWPDILNDDSSD